MQHNTLILYNTPIWQQLQIEEALLRSDQEHWVIINVGTPPAIVVGVGGKVNQLIDRQKVQEKPIPIIRRFSGGGTVVVDQETIFVTLIHNKDKTSISPFPAEIMQWTEQLYRPVFGKNFSLKENDYCFGEKKFGGNAQSITKSRWLHHTSFLWNYSEESMNYLLLPIKRPDYRKDRPHKDFLFPLSSVFSSKKELIEKIQNLFCWQDHKEDCRKKINRALEKKHRRATKTLLADRLDCVSTFSVKVGPLLEEPSGYLTL